MHHGVKILVPLAGFIWETFFTNGTNDSSTDTTSILSYQYCTGLVAIYLLYRYSCSPALLVFVLSRAMFPLPRASAPYTARNLLFDSEWTWYIVSPFFISSPDTRFYLGCSGITTLFLLGRLAVDLFTGVAYWRNLLPFRFIFAGCFAAICFLSGKPTNPVRSKKASSAPPPEEIGRTFYLSTKNLRAI